MIVLKNCNGRPNPTLFSINIELIVYALKAEWLVAMQRVILSTTDFPVCNIYSPQSH